MFRAGYPWARLKSEPSHESTPHPTDPRASEPDGAYADWVQRARTGDRTATGWLVEHHQAQVARLLWRFVRTQSDLDDLVQETFLRMIRSLSSWRSEQPFSHWLLRIATNVGRDYFRRQSVRRRWMSAPNSENPVDPIDPGSDPAARAAANEVKTMLAQLAPDDRALLTLHYLEGWELSRIAAQFGWTVTATKLRAWRARRQIRSLFQSSPHHE